MLANWPQAASMSLPLLLRMLTMIFLDSDFGISEWVNNLLYKKLHTGSGGYRYFQDDSRKCPYHITVAVHGLNMLYKKSNPKINSFITIP